MKRILIALSILGLLLGLSLVPVSAQDDQAQKIVATVNTTSDTINSVLKQYVPHDYPKSSLPDPSKPGRYKVKSLTYGVEPLAFFSSTPDIAAPAVKLPDFLADWSRNVNSNMSNAYHLFDSSSPNTSVIN
jgi:hypothetical protein